MIYTFLADGFEDVEALGVIDVCRRAGLEVTTVSIMPTEVVESAHGVRMIADTLFADNDYGKADLLFLPGGMPGAQNLNDCEPLTEAVMQHYKAGKPLAAICAAPMVYGNLGILGGKKATCYPGFEKFLTGATCTAALTEHDGQFFTGKGPAAALQLGYDIVAHFCGANIAETLKAGMMYNDL
ncbi:MAG: DJ-1/PfpI family protein [Bacteroidaceae bacterium]|nr:DJ-1/PfpI family protein [Bacteroidaceae bacterium]